MPHMQDMGVYPPNFNRYISLVEDEELNSILKKQPAESSAFFNSIPQDKWLYKYAENKWTIKEVLQHITDTERIFSFRALVFARKDPNTFPSFNENEYAKNSNANDRNPADLIEEFLAVRKSTQLLFESFSDEQLNAIGKASSYEMSVKAVGYMIAGHFTHHLKILKERYFTD
ncbi:MAG: DinB family protein [Bacteroidota bacterium]|nr:DinB family protein [Bacteroidota bacterium]